MNDDRSLVAVFALLIFLAALIVLPSLLAPRTATTSLTCPPAASAPTTVAVVCQCTPSDEVDEFPQVPASAILATKKPVASSSAAPTRKAP